MAKLALLIGVSEYEPGLNPLPAAAMDVQAIVKVLQHPEMGGFAETDIQQLLNPEPQRMHEAIEALFSDRRKDDLVLLYFSGHGIKDDSGKLYLATRITRKNTQGRLVKSTSVPAGFVHNVMSDSRSKRQVVILDCCFSGAFAEGWSAKDDGFVDIYNQLGGEGRVVLTSSTSTQYSFEQDGANLSTYTRYLVEGIETGAADRDNDGVISVDELHEYAKKKVKEAAPAMQPEIYAVKEGFKIRLAKAPIGDPKLKYRKEVELFASRGEISPIRRRTLDLRRESLGLSFDEAVAIETEVLKPYQEYKKRLEQYEQGLVEEIRKQYPLSEDTRNELKLFQEALGLTDKDVEPIEARLASQQVSIVSPKSNTQLDHWHNREVPPSTPLNEVAIQSVKTTETEALATYDSREVRSHQGLEDSLHTKKVPTKRNLRLILAAGISTTLVLFTGIYFFQKHQSSDLPIASQTPADSLIDSGLTINPVESSSPDFSPIVISSTSKPTDSENTDTDKQRQSEEEARKRQAEQEAKQRQAEQEAKQRQEQEAKQRQVEQEAKQRQEQEAKQRQSEQEAKQRQAEQEAKQRQEQEAKQRQAEQEAKQRQEQEAKQRQEQEAKQLTVPTQLSPSHGTVFDHYPRKTTLTWNGVPGATSYKIEIQYCQPAGCTATEPRLGPVREAFTTTYSFNFVGAQPGRWRVWAVGVDGKEGTQSDWWEFRYTR